MNAKINNWLVRIDQNTQAFQSTFGHLSKEQLNRKPNAETWSIAQNIDHLMVINNTYPPIIKEIRRGTYKLGWMSKIGFLVRFFGRMILGSVKPDRKRKMKTFSIWEPEKTAVEEDILAKYAQHQTELKQLIQDCADLLEKGQVIGSPANKKIVYTLENAFEIIVTHEERHLEQAKQCAGNIEH